MMTKPAEVQKLAEIVTNLQHWLKDQRSAKQPAAPFFQWRPDRQQISCGGAIVWDSRYAQAAPTFLHCKTVYAATFHETDPARPAV